MEQIQPPQFDPVQYAIHRCQLVEMVLPGMSGGNQAGKLQFIDQPYLRGVNILGIEIYDSSDISLSPQGNVPATWAELSKSFLTLYCNTPESPGNLGEWLQLIPSASLHRIENATPDPFVRRIFPMAGQVVSWDKCFFSFASPLANTVPVAFLLNVYFYGDPIS